MYYFQFSVGNWQIVAATATVNTIIQFINSPIYYFTEH